MGQEWMQHYKLELTVAGITAVEDVAGGKETIPTSIALSGAVFLASRADGDVGGGVLLKGGLFIAT